MNKATYKKQDSHANAIFLVYKFGYPDYESLRYWFYNKLEHSAGRLVLQCYL